MNGLKEFFNYLTNSLKFWFIIKEWDSGLHLRNGKVIRKLKGGFYLKIPFLDNIFSKPLREKDIILSQINFTTKDHENITTTGCVVYKINDIEKFYNGYSEPDSIIANKANSEICDYFLKTNYKDFNKKEIEGYVLNELLKIKDKGFEFIDFNITTFSKCRTYRIIKDNLYSQRSNKLDEEVY